MISGTAVGSRDDVFPFPAAWLGKGEVLYTADGRICVSNTLNGATREIPFQARITLHRPSYRHKRFSFDSPSPQPVKGIVSPAISPDGKRIVFEALNQLWLMEIGKAPRVLTHDGYYKEDPAWSPDGTRIAYSSDKAGTEDLYILDLVSKTERRVTSLPGSAEVAAAWSPDGNSIAFQDQTGATFVLGLAGGQVRRVIPPQFEPSKPSWSADGKTIAIAALKPYTRRFREGTNQILTVNLAGGTVSYTEPAPFESISTRGEDGPIYSPDGSAMAYVMGSRLWIRPADSNGLPSGTARRINGEVTDAPTWTKDSKHLLYLSNGRLRLISVDGSHLRTVPLRLSWRQEQPLEQTLIHAGRLWDGLGAVDRTDVDILVVKNRIRSVEPHREEAHRLARKQRVRYVDASNLTVIPGLWESHTHEWISGKFYGDRLGRLWLAYGVTSLHSQGDPAYRAVETREASASGSRVGPRFFATGEPIDGERIYYGFMRPTTSEEQLALELSRARALKYDSLKTYVRLPLTMQREAMRFAHRNMGVVAASHSMLPGIGYGMDGMTHVAATSRYGFSYTRSADGVSYQGMKSVFADVGVFDISTPFSSCALYTEDPTMVDDQRLLVLNTPWDQSALRSKRDRVISTDQHLALNALEREEETLSNIVRSGGTMLAGSDSPLDDVATALLLNLRAQVKFGLPPWRALQTATLFPARAFGVARDLGSVEPGKLADLVFVAGNPLRNIRELVNVRSVMKNGTMYSVSALAAPFARQEIAAASVP